jgi:hypothetical protein
VDKLGAIKEALEGTGDWIRPGKNQKRKKELIDIGLRMGFKGFGNFIQDGLKGHWTKNRGSIFCQSTAQKYIHGCVQARYLNLKITVYVRRLTYVYLNLIIPFKM